MMNLVLLHSFVLSNGGMHASRPGSALRPSSSRPGSALLRPSNANPSAHMGALEGSENNSGELNQFRMQLAGLSDINRTLLEKCKAAKADKAALQKQLEDKDSTLKMLEAKYKLLVKKFSSQGNAAA